MKKFILKVILYSCIVTTLYGGVLLFDSPPIRDISSDYMASIIDKHARLEKFDNNRLIFIGGSNLAFGIDSKRIQDSLHKNVINLGIHGGLGMPFMMEEAKAIVKSGDIIILSIEYELYNPENTTDVELVNYTQKIFPPSNDYYNYSLADIIILSHKTFKKTFYRSLPPANDIYCRKCFNEFGDITAHLNKPRIKNIYSKEKIHSSDIRAFINKANELSEKCKKIGASIYFIFPAYGQNEYNINKEVIKQIEANLNKNLTSIPIITSPEIFIFDNSLFFDSVYHLNAEGREMRTNILIKILQKYLTPKRT